MNSAILDTILWHPSSRLALLLFHSQLTGYLANGKLQEKEDCELVVQTAFNEKRKAWKNGEVRALSRAKKSCLTRTYNTARARLKAGIKEAKQRHEQRLERNLNTNNTKDTWQAIKNITGYKSSSAPIMCEATLPDELNSFYAHFDILNKESGVKSTPPPEDLTLTVSTVDVRRILLRVNMNKAAGPDNIPGCVLKHVPTS
eukprot:superscaffoldBa00000114_g1659